jgi:hypothetical protein
MIGHYMYNAESKVAVALVSLTLIPGSIDLASQPRKSFDIKKVHSRTERGHRTLHSLNA